MEEFDHQFDSIKQHQFVDSKYLRTLTFEVEISPVG